MRSRSLRLRVGRDDSRRQHQLAMLALVLVAVFAPGPVLVQERSTTGGDVLLTFDTEFEDDAASLLALGIDVPATYFWTGSYAQKYPDLLRDLAEQGNTIGSHSFHHDDLTVIDARQAQLDLQLARLVLEQIAGVPVTAFRAPYLEYDDAVMVEVARLGHVVDSSDKSPWPRNRHLLEVAISEYENLLVSDYDLFEGRGLDDATSRDFLIRAYEHHASEGRPFVVLLHPRIIGRHAVVLHDFIAHVNDTGGRFLTLDSYLDVVARPQGPRRRVVWLELSTAVKPESLAVLAASEAASDVILSLPDLAVQTAFGPTTVAAIVADLQAGGIRVHLAYPVGQNPALARSLPDGVMMDSGGARSSEWVSPSHPVIRHRLVEDAVRLVAGLGVDGLHLHGVGYPGLTWDFSPAALHRFSADRGLSTGVPDDILARHYLIWTQWRARELASLVTEIVVAVRGAVPDMAVSLAVEAGSTTDYRAMERTGQDLRLLGGLVDLVVLWSIESDHPGQPTPGQTLLAARTQGGDALLLIGLRRIAANTLGLRPPESDVLALRMAISLTGGRVIDTEVEAVWPCCLSGLMVGATLGQNSTVP